PVAVGEAAAAGAAAAGAAAAGAVVAAAAGAAAAGAAAAGLVGVTAGPLTEPVDAPTPAGTPPAPGTKVAPCAGAAVAVAVAPAGGVCADATGTRIAVANAAMAPARTMLALPTVIPSPLSRVLGHDASRGAPHYHRRSSLSLAC